MNWRLLSLCLLVISGSFAQDANQVCEMCTATADYIAGYALQSMPRDEIYRELKTACSKIGQATGAIDAQQCEDFISIYFEYIMDYMTDNNITPSGVCQKIGICSSGSEAQNYMILLPYLGESTILYYANHEKGGKNVFYKFFLGNATEFFGTEDTQIDVHATSTGGSLITLSVSVADADWQQTHSTPSEYANDCDADGCQLLIDNAVSGKWVYVQIDATNAQEFSFNATQRKRPQPTIVSFTNGRRHGLSLISFVLLISTLGAVLCLCISFCMRLRRGNLNRSRGCKKVELQQIETEHVAVPLETMEYEVNQPLVGYYYYPEQGLWVPSYAEFQPQAPQPFPQAPPQE